MKKSFFYVLSLAALSYSTSAYAQTANLQGNAQRGASKNSMCIGCHGIVGYKTAFPVVYNVPKIGGQSAAYITSALHAYKKGERTHASMRAVAASLSEQDILDLAAYYSQQSAQQSGSQR